MSSNDKEPFSPDFRYETVVKTLKGLADGDVFYDRDRWRDNIDGAGKGWKKQISDSMNSILNGSLIFADPNSSQEARNGVEQGMFTSILFLRSIGILRDALNRDEIISGMARIEVKQDALSALLKDVLSVLTGLTDLIEERLPK